MPKEKETAMPNQIANVQPKTMSSLELVKIINDLREEGQAELAHSDFMKKIVKVLGEVGAGNFSATYKDSQNKVRPCYNLPKREACLMILSESHKVMSGWLSWKKSNPIDEQPYQTIGRKQDKDHENT